MKVLSFNLGLLGHVDCGKTSLAKCLSMVSSTACFDKNPQSQERGITIDLGFSSFTAEAPFNTKDSGYDLVQYTLVDCPGHASLIRTIIGGAQIIDLVLLLVDITKGIQTQTAECLVIAEIMEKPIIVVINKIDLIPEGKRESTINKVSNKIKKTLMATSFKSAPLVSISAKVEENDLKNTIFGIEDLIKVLQENTFVPERFPCRPMILSVDHCFLIKGKGTIMTGTVLQGTLRVHDEIEIPCLKQIKKVKSIQMFKADITEAVPGDRIGVCVTQFNPKLLERGIACCPGHVPLLYGAIIKLNYIRYFKSKISTRLKFHVSVGHETVIAKITLFSTNDTSKAFTFHNEYAFEDEYDVEDNKKVTYALLEFEKSVIAPTNSLIVCSKFDVDVQTNSCRIAFYGKSEYDITDCNYQLTVLPKLLIFKRKQKVGSLQRVCNNNQIIASLFKKQTKVQEEFINLKIKLSTGEEGVIESTFGQGGKVKIRIPDGLSTETLERMKFGKTYAEPQVSQPVKVILHFKKFVFDKDKRIVQSD